jgi:hypothetical protein
MQAASERPQLGGVISRTVVLSRRSAFADSRTAVSKAFPTPPALKAESQKVHLVRRTHAALLLVDLEPHAPLKETADRSHDALAGPRTAYEDIAIVGVAHEPMAPPFQFAVQFVKDDVGQQRRQRPSLRCSFRDGDLRSVRHHHARRQHMAHHG